MRYFLFGRFVGWLVNVLTFPGVIVHEVAHVIFCRLVGVTVHEVVYFTPFGNPSGYVLHDVPANLGQQFWITVGPFIINSTLCFIGGAVALFWSTARPGAELLNGALMWISVSVGMHAIPSLGDANSLWEYATGSSTGSTLSKVLAFPVVAVLVVGSLLRFFWADLVYALVLFYSPSAAASGNLVVLSPQNYKVATPKPTAVQPLMPTSVSTSQPVVIRLPSATPVLPERPTQDTQLWVCVELAYGYSGPGFAYPVVWQMSQKDGWTVHASDKGGPWWTIRTENGNVFMHEATLCSYPPTRPLPRAPTPSPSPTPVQVFENLALVQTAEITGSTLLPTIAVLDKGVVINAARIGHSEWSSRQTQFRMRFRVSMLDLAGNYIRAQTKLGALDQEDDRGHPKTIGSMKKDWPILEIQTDGDIATVTIEGWINDSALP